MKNLKEWIKQYESEEETSHAPPRWSELFELVRAIEKDLEANNEDHNNQKRHL